MAQGFSLKDQLFNHETVRYLGGLFDAADVFKADPFVADVMAQMLPLELKARINLIADVLADHLPDDFQDAAVAINKALPPPLDPSLRDDDFGHFIFAPLGVFVENQGLDDHFATSISLIEALTQRFSMEFSVRAFLNRWPVETMVQMSAWSEHDSYHVRRLVSEGTRPRLPWGQNVGLTAADTLPLLEKLHGDSTRFVTRSVANHLNDITKIDPDVVLCAVEKWRGLGLQNVKELNWIERHALRGLIKSGHGGAMAHLGFDPDVAVRVINLAIEPNDLSIGEMTEISFDLCLDDDAPLIVDYVIYFMKANGKTAPKVFKMKVLDGKAKAPNAFRKAHHFKKGATTFTHYPGAHKLAIQVNGRIVAEVPFNLS